MNETQKAQALKLLAKTGNHQAIEAFSGAYAIDEAIKESCLDLATIYRAIRALKSLPTQHEPARLFQFFNEGQAARYFNTNDDADILLDLIGVLKLFIDANDDDTEKILAFDVLAIPVVKEALRRRTNNLTIRRELANLLESGWLLIFNYGTIDRIILTHYFPIFNFWQDLVVSKETLVATVIEKWSLHFGARPQALAYILERDDDWNKKFIYLALEQLNRLTSKAAVSRLMHQHFDSTDRGLLELLNDGLIDPVLFVPTPVDQAVTKLLDDYENLIHVNLTAAKRLTKKLNDYLESISNPDQIKEIAGTVAIRMSHWLSWRKFYHLSFLLQQPNLPYSKNLFIGFVEPNLVVAWKNKDWEKLIWVLENLPLNTFDQNNPDLEPIIKAWQIYHDSK